MKEVNLTPEGQEPKPDPEKAQALENIQRIAELLGAKIVDKVPEVEPGIYGAARLAEILAERLEPGQGKRPGRPTNPSWVRRPKVSMSEDTLRRLIEIAESASSDTRKVSPMQVAAQLLEDAVKQFFERHPEKISE